MSAGLRRSCAAVFLLSALIAPAAPAQGITGTFDANFDDRPWSDVAAHLPKFPEPSDLVEIQVLGEQTNKFLIDIASVDLGSDAVVRYTILTRSSSGAETLTYEGIRCSAAERRLYAYGRTNRSWERVSNSKWRDIVLIGSLNDYHAALYLNYFCRLGMPLKTRQMLVDTIKHGGLPKDLRN
jgi:hypothetical protein